MESVSEEGVNVSTNGNPPQKSKKIIPIIIALILLITIGSIVYWQYFRTPKENYQLDSSEEQSEEEITEKKGISFKNVIEKCEDAEDYFKSACIISACDAIGSTEERIERCINKENYYEKDVCLNAITPKTMEVCENTSDNNKDFCYLGIAEETGDASMCDKISPGFNEKAPCYIKTAKENKNSDICKKIESNDYKNWCLAVATGDASKCNNMKYKKSACYIDVAKEKDDPSICNIFEGFDKEAFKNSCYVAIAHLRKDISLCDNINENYREACYQEAKDDYEKSMCSSIVEYSKKLCIKEVKAHIAYEEAMNKENYSICEEEIPAEEIKDLDYSPEHYINECYYNFAIENGDVSLCNKMSLKGSFASDMKLACYWYFIEPIAEELNKNFDKEDKALYDQYCK